MREATQGGCTRQSRADARRKVECMREASQGGCARQGRADAQGNAGRMPIEVQGV
jgi:hypothetical protein